MLKFLFTFRLNLFTMDNIHRVTVIHAESARACLLELPSSIDELVKLANESLNLKNSSSLCTPMKAIVSDIRLVRDNDVLYIHENNSVTSKLCTLESKNTESDLYSVNCRDGSTFPSDWVVLNVGGKHFSTTRSTLMTKEPGCMLARMFSSPGEITWQNWKDDSGAYLIDRSPIYFEPILNYLRHGQLIIDRGISLRGILEEAKFFGVTSLIDILECKITEEEKANESSVVSRKEFVMRLFATPANCELRCQGMDFTGVDLSKLDLRNINFKHAIFHSTNLTLANLSHCCFDRADLSHAKLDGANLLGIKMLCANLEGASLKGCNFEDPAGSRANLEGANMKNVKMEGSRMAAVNLRVANLKNAELQNCDLRGAVLAGADLENCDMTGCDLQEANLRGANLMGASFDLMVNPLHMSQTVRY